MGTKHRDGCSELLIQNVDSKIKQEIKSIAKSKNMTTSYLLRPLLREFVEKHTPEQRNFKD